MTWNRFKLWIRYEGCRLPQAEETNGRQIPPQRWRNMLKQFAERYAEEYGMG